LMPTVQPRRLAQLEPITEGTSTAPMDLSTVLGAAAEQSIQTAGKIVFHTVGDTGGIHNPEFQFAVAGAMSDDTASGACFWYHLGDVVYYMLPGTVLLRTVLRSLPQLRRAHLRNSRQSRRSGLLRRQNSILGGLSNQLCAAQPGRNPDSQGAVRTTMDQPGVYFTLNAPFVKFIGLYTNTGEGSTEGVISGAKVGNAQLSFLQQQLGGGQSGAGQRAGARVDHRHASPSIYASPQHVPSPTMLQQIDQACAAAGIQPDLHLSGHAHLYERNTRTGRRKTDSVRGRGHGRILQSAGTEAGDEGSAAQHSSVRHGRE
jgi:hypothetical protein